jgi:aminocarboxymuconate-semialdehyde decarboxylase
VGAALAPTNPGGIRFVTILDVHNHFYPPAYLDALRDGSSAVRVTDDRDGNPVIHYPGDYNVAVPGHRDIAYRTGVLELEDVRQLISLTTPGVHVEAAPRAAMLARLVNDAFAEVVRTRRGRYAALATLPLNDPAAAVRELERAMDTLGLPGAMLFSNVNGVALADPRFEALYQAADARGAVLMIHPTHPLGVEAMTEYWLMPLVGFPTDTTLAAAHLVFAGVPARYPKIRWILGHLGGAIPYLAERLDRGWRAFAECRAHIAEPPSEYLKRHFWYDTVNFDPAALRLAIEFAGAGHVLAGSDYPHMIGSIPRMREAITSLPIPEADKQRIMIGNAKALNLA